MGGGLNRRRFLAMLAGSVPALALWAPTARASSISQADVLDYLRTRVNLLPRASWTSIPPRATRMATSKSFTRLTIHHTGAGENHHLAQDQVAFDIENILGAHHRRLWGDIGYHFVIDRAGRVWEGRSMQYTGAHVSAENAENIGVVLLGNFERQRPPPQQLLTMHKLADALRSRMAIPQSRVYGHRDLGQTLCPGRFLYGTVGALRNP